MFQALFNSLSGLFSFSRGLNTISNNVSNMNTPGFRGSDAFFENVRGGLGSRISGEGMRTEPGDIRQTGNATDLAVDGEGYFILRDRGGELHYTRAGQFRFNEKGVLVDTVSDYEVMGYDANHNLASIDLSPLRTLPPTPTTRVDFKGNLNATLATPPATASPHTIPTVTVFDAAGNARKLSVTFTRTSTSTPVAFDVEVKDDTGASIARHQLRFDFSNTPSRDTNQLTVSLPSGGSAPTQIVFNFGTPNGFDGLTTLGVAANATATVKDGHAILGYNDASFDEKGVLQLSYSATEKREGPRMALAILPNESSLKLDGGRMVSGPSVQEKELGNPGETRFGRVVARSLELSNIDLTREFADMIIIQRGYQASSRVMTVSNEMIEQLYNSTRGS